MNHGALPRGSRHLTWADDPGPLVATGRFFATRPLIASALSKWGHVLLPLVLIALGLLILVEGGALGL